VAGFSSLASYRKSEYATISEVGATCRRRVLTAAALSAVIDYCYGNARISLHANDVEEKGFDCGGE